MEKSQIIARFTEIINSCESDEPKYFAFVEDTEKYHSLGNCTSATYQLFLIELYNSDKPLFDALATSIEHIKTSMASIEAVAAVATTKKRIIRESKANKIKQCHTEPVEVQTPVIPSEVENIKDKFCQSELVENQLSELKNKKSFHSHTNP